MRSVNMGVRILFIVGLFCLTWADVQVATQTIEQKLRDDTDLSQFYEMINSNTIAQFNLKNKQITIFAPTNSAFQRHQGSVDEPLILYHMTNLAVKIDELSSPLNSEMEGNTPLWITYKREDSGNEIYINNAQIILSRSNYVGMANGKKQVLHVIDEVLVPVMSTLTTNNQIHNPNAYQFLNQSESLAIGPHRLRSFRQKVNQNKKINVFESEGRHTFFIPVDEGFKPVERADKLDDKVIDGHVIPNHVLFTTPTPQDHPFETLAFGDNLKVITSFTSGPNQENGKQTRDPNAVFIKSNTLVGDSMHSAGVVLAEIIRPNIPVKNGVIHLIQRPLMVVDTTISQFLEASKEDGPLYKFYETIMDSEVGQQFLASIKRMRDVTLFAPSNTAWQDGSLRNLLRNEDRMRDILNLHLVRDQRLSTDKIKQNNLNQIFQVPTAADRKHLYFNVINNGHEEVLTVEGGGVNATVVQANIAATNGIVHIIDRVLGVPYTTVLEKLKTDPMLNDTFFLGERTTFNKQLNDSTKKFTYFVPRDRAWRKAEISMPSTLKKLFMPEFSYHANQVLERHLVIADVPYTIERLKQMMYESNKNSVELPTVRDNLSFRLEEKDKSFTIVWRNMKINVFRPDVECTNGIIHVIDQPFLQDGDVRVNGSPSIFAPIVHHLLMLVAVKWLLL